MRALLGLTENPNEPDFYTTYMDLNYSASTGMLTGSGGQTAGFPGGIIDPNTQLIGSGDYDFSAKVNSSGQLQPGGTFAIYGDIGNGNELLLSGNLAAMGWPGQLGARTKAGLNSSSMSRAASLSFRTIF